VLGWQRIDRPEAGSAMALEKLRRPAHSTCTEGNGAFGPQDAALHLLVVC
jgi:hypothetical protein